MADADTTSLLGTIGTWVGVALALLALLGIVGPLLAIIASTTERQQALSQVHDKNQDYVTKGYGISTTNRYLRKVKVPTLFSYYAVRIPAADQPWTLHTIESTTCRTGWARLCRVLEAYDATLPSGEPTEASLCAHLFWILRIRFFKLPKTTGKKVPVVNDKNGSLYFEAKHTWLPVQPLLDHDNRSP
ncbi:hypothetical protein B0H63DRAFT_564710, partial [Podospora didyma]